MNKEKSRWKLNIYHVLKKRRIERIVLTVTDIFRRHRSEENKLGCKNTYLLVNMISKG